MKIGNEAFEDLYYIFERAYKAELQWAYYLDSEYLFTIYSKYITNFLLNFLQSTIGCNINNFPYFYKHGSISYSIGPYGRDSDDALYSLYQASVERGSIAARDEVKISLDELDLIIKGYVSYLRNRDSNVLSADCQTIYHSIGNSLFCYLFKMIGLLEYNFNYDKERDELLYFTHCKTYNLTDALKPQLLRFYTEVIEDKYKI